jgi:hypothetical protein
MRPRQSWVRAGVLVAALTLVSATGARYASTGSVTYHAPGRIVELVGNAKTVAALIDSKGLGCLVVRWRPGHLANLRSAKAYADEVPSPRNRGERCGTHSQRQMYYRLAFRGDAIRWSFFACGNDCYRIDASWRGAHVAWVGAGGESGDLGSHDEVQTPKRPKLRPSVDLARGRVKLSSTNALVYIKR